MNQDRLKNDYPDVHTRAISTVHAALDHIADALRYAIAYDRKPGVTYRRTWRL